MSLQWDENMYHVMLDCPSFMIGDLGYLFCKDSEWIMVSTQLGKISYRRNMNEHLFCFIKFQIHDVTNCVHANLFSLKVLVFMYFYGRLIHFMIIHIYKLQYTFTK